MGTATRVTLRQYLATTYRADCDYVDGVLEKRNGGQEDHSNLQGEIYSWFRDRRRSLRLKAFVELRIQVKTARFRIPDVTVTRMPEPDEQVLTQPPYICIEILSPEDSLVRLQDRLDDYIGFGVPNTWVLDPLTRRSWWADDKGLHPVRDGIPRLIKLPASKYS